jgi:cathepsin E
MTGYWGEHSPLSMFSYSIKHTFCSIGPQILTFGTLSPDNTSVTPTVTDNLFDKKKIKNNLVAVSLEPTKSVPAINGQLTFGGTDGTKHTGSITYL